MVKKAFLTLAVIAVLVAGVIPSCGDSGCCSHAEEASVQRVMPCCQEASMASRDAVRVVATASASAVHPVAVAESPIAFASVAPQRAPLPLARVASDLHEPPLFLRNAQLLI